jgi:opacity protein-like surface antigen
MKKLTTALCLSAALFATTAVHAQWQYSALVGVSGAHLWGDADVNYFVYDSIEPDNFKQKFEVDNDRWAFGILGGFQAKCNRLLLGLELNIDWQNDHNIDGNLITVFNNSPFSSLAIDYDNDAVVGLTGRIGYDINSWLMTYARAGVETYERDLSYTNTSLITVFSSAGDASRRTWTFVGGLGAEVPVPVLAGLSLRAEWNYHARGKSVEVTALLTDGQTFDTVSVRPDASNSVKASLVYNFPV